MYAVIETGGKQYRVEVGTELEIERLEAGPGESVAFDRVLLVADGDTASIGRPVVANASVAAEVVRRERGEKVISFKYRPKARRRVKKGHRQELTLIRISDIVLDGKSAAEEAQQVEEARVTERQRLEEGARRQAAKDAELAAKLAAAEKAAAPKPSATAKGDTTEGGEAPSTGKATTSRAARAPRAAAAPKATNATKANATKAGSSKADPAKAETSSAETPDTDSTTATETESDKD
jgi:large subunit ribosomal protein L21